MSKQINIEVCANSVQSVVEAEKGGAIRVELCDNLYEGGTTPSAASIKLAKQKSSIKINVIIRPRGGDFCYSDLEFETMKQDIEIAKTLGADGVVFGILLADGNVDTVRNSILKNIAGDLSTTFHRAFDVVKNPQNSLNDIIDIGFDRLLTSGLQPSAYQGKTLIKSLIEESKNKIIIMPGSGISETNVRELVDYTGAQEIHLSGQVAIESKMQHKSSNVKMNAFDEMNEFIIKQTSADRIKNILSLANISSK